MLHIDYNFYRNLIPTMFDITISARSVLESVTPTTATFGPNPVAEICNAIRTRWIIQFH